MVRGPLLCPAAVSDGPVVLEQAFGNVEEGHDEGRLPAPSNLLLLWGEFQAAGGHETHRRVFMELLCLRWGFPK